MNNFTIEVALKPTPELEALLRAVVGGAQPVTAAPAAPPAVPADTPVAATTPAAPPAAPAVPTTERAYTLEELGRAGAELMDKGKGAEAVALMGKFGVTSISDLKPDQYGAMATELRGLGAKI